MECFHNANAFQLTFYPLGMRFEQQTCFCPPQHYFTRFQPIPPVLPRTCLISHIQSMQFCFSQISTHQTTLIALLDFFNRFWHFLCIFVYQACPALVLNQHNFLSHTVWLRLLFFSCYPVFQKSSYRCLFNVPFAILRVLLHLLSACCTSIIWVPSTQCRHTI